MTCPICGGTDRSFWGAANGYYVVQCTGCGLGMTTPFPEPGVLLDVNRETYPVAGRVDAYRSRQEYFSRRYRRQLVDIGAFVKGGRLLDIGCNIGMFLAEAARAGYDVTGVELNGECADYARATFGFDVRSDYLENIGFPDATFDVVTMYDVLEHVPDMAAILTEIRRILRPGGLLVVQSPNLDSLMAELTGSSWSWLSPPDHLYHFTPSSLAALLHRAGFAVRTVKTWEPADDFCNDLFQAKLGSSVAARAVRKLVRLSRVAELSVAALQPLWWRRSRGALVEAYGVKPVQEDGTP